MSQCNPDGGTLIGIIILGVFIACTGGLLSKEKSTRMNALQVGMAISIGGTLVIWITGCQ